MRSKCVYLLGLYILFYCFIFSSTALAEEDHEHYWSEWTVEQDSCEVAGTKTRFCYLCDETETVSIPAGKHSWGEWEEDEYYGCEEPITEIRECQVCEETETRTIPAQGHVWSAWSVDYEPECEMKGMKSRECDECGKSETKSIPALGHNFGKWKITKKATCTVNGRETRVCKRCEEEETKKIKAIGHHTWGKWTITKIPTCSDYGAKKRVCSVCKEKETKEVKPDKKNHKFDRWKVEKEATAFDTGLQTRKCLLCSKSEKAVIEIQKATNGSGKKDRAVLTVVNTFLKCGKYYNTRQLEKCLSKNQKWNGFMTDEMAKVAKACNQNYFSYVITDVKLTGKKASVEVSVRYRNMKALFVKAQDRVDNKYDTYDSSSKTIKKWIEKECAKIYTSNKKVTYKVVNFSIPLNKESGKWKISKLSTQLKDAFQMGYYSFCSEYL